MYVTVSKRIRSKKLIVNDIDGGLRFSEQREDRNTPGRVFGTAFGLLWIALGVGMLFIPERAMPGAGLGVKALIGAVLALLGGFMVVAIWRNLSSVLEINFMQQILHHYYIDNRNRKRKSSEIAFVDVKGVFTEAWKSPKISGNTIRDERVRLIVNYRDSRGRPGRLVAVTSGNKEVSAIRDLILTEALNRQAAPTVQGVSSFVQRTKWELKQRMQ